jgi:cyclase
MLRNRVIPVLLVQRDRLVKTRQFRDPVYVGDPINAVRIFNEKGVDELALLDISASRDGVGPNFSLVNEVASECFMPLSYGGGVRSQDDAGRLFAAGVEKVVIRTAAARDITVISDIASVNGTQSVAVAVDVDRRRLGGYKVHAPGTPRHGDADWIGFVEEAVRAGAGELVLTSVERDGTMKGMDAQLIGAASESIGVPLLAVGGVGSLADIGDGIKAGADAVGAGAYFVFHGPRRAVLITYPTQQQLAAVQREGGNAS